MKILNGELIDALIKENEELIKENEALTDDYKAMKKAMLDERRQKNNLNHLYQKIKMDHRTVEKMEEKLAEACNAQYFDETRADDLIRRLNIAKGMIEMEAITIDKETMIKLINWIVKGGLL